MILLDQGSNSGTIFDQEMSSGVVVFKTLSNDRCTNDHVQLRNNMVHKCGDCRSGMTSMDSFSFHFNKYVSTSLRTSMDNSLSSHDLNR